MPEPRTRAAPPATKLTPAIATGKARRSREPAATPNQATIPDHVETALDWLRSHSSKRTRDGMARYGIPSDNALGVSVGDIRLLGKRLGRNHELAAALWETGCYEARMLTAFIDEPALVTSAQMDRWCRDFDSWAICDTLCFHLFDRTPHAWAKVEAWSDRRAEFVRRAAFALLASLAGHDKTAGDERFLACLPLIDRAATDERNFVKKGVSWALRGIGRRNPALHAPAVELARRLAESADAAARWIGRDTIKDLASPAVTRRLAARRGAKPREERQRRIPPVPRPVQ